MKICQVTPGIMPIPPNGWGAIEKIIWEYKLNLEKQGHVCDIKYLDDVRKEDYDVIHIHVANLAIMAHDRGLPYVFTMHDHHTELYGKDSTLYKQNREAMEKSVVSFVPARHLVEYFDTPKVQYLRHGVNSSFFTPPTKNIFVHKLLCVGNNGLCGDPSVDRKGFVYAIEAARQLNMQITIAGPSNNKKFFETNKEYKPYDKTTFLYDLSEDELKSVYQSHSIFLHPSSLEAGHPNLTLLEAMACGLPTVSTYDHDALNGMVRVDRDVNSVKQGIMTVVKNFSSLKAESRKTAEQNDWYNVVMDMATLYSNIDSYRMKNELTEIYRLTKTGEKQEQRPSIFLNFHNGAQISISGGSPDETYSFEFINSDKDKSLYGGQLKTNHWAKCAVSKYTPYRIKVIHKEKLLLDYFLNLKDKNVLIILDSTSLGDTIAWFPFVEEFRKKHQCNVTCSTNWCELFESNYPDVKFQPLTWSGDFYAIYKIGCYKNELDSPYSYKDVPLQKISSSILGLRDEEIVPKIVVKDTVRKIPNKYVCFAMESTAQAKFWNNPTGWQEVVNYLNSIGLEPVLIQAGQNDSLKNIRNLSGKKSIHDTINYIHNSEFFIGIGSGLSWLAWGLNKPVVLISGFSLPKSEFNTPYRVINNNVCHGCWNEHDFDKGDWNWCPKHKNTPRQFECSIKITSDMVIEKINKLLSCEKSIHQHQ